MTHVSDAGDYDALHDLMARRRDVRRFRTDPVNDDLLGKLFDIVALSPSVGNSQPWRWVSVGTRDARDAVRANFREANAKARDAVPNSRKALYDSLKLAGLKEAPVQYAVFCNPETSQGGGLGRQTQPEALHYSVACAVMAFWLAAKSVGLGVGWVSIVAPQSLSEALEVPKIWDLVAYLCVGYPVEAHYDPELQRHGWQERVWSQDDLIHR